MATFTLTASPPPATDLSVAVIVSELGEFADNGQIGARTVTIGEDGIGTLEVTTNDDHINEQSGRITADIESSDGEGYAISSISDSAFITVNDNDTPVVRVSAELGEIEEGDVASFKLTADPPPSVPLQVVVTVRQLGIFVDHEEVGSKVVTIGEDGIGTLEITTNDDYINEKPGRIAADIESGDGEEYSVSSISDSAFITVSDNDTPFVRISTELGEIEEGDVASFKLTTDPPSSVPFQVAVTVSQLGIFVDHEEVGPRMVTIGEDGIGILLVETDDDNTREGSGRITATIEDGDNYEVSALERSAFVIVNDNDASAITYGVWISKDSIEIDEAASLGGSNEATYKVQLLGAQFPDDPIRVEIDLVSDPSGVVTVSPRTLTFLPSNFLEPRTVTVTAVDDEVDNSGDVREVKITHRLDATNTPYDGLTVQDVTVTVKDNDGAPELSVVDAAVAEGDSGEAVLTFSVTLSAASGMKVTVDWADAGLGTADSGVDYDEVAGGTLVFEPGETLRIIDVAITGDTAAEADETVVLRLSSPEGAVFANDDLALDFTGTITNDDTAGVTPSSSALTLVEGQKGTYSISLSSSPGDGVSVVVYPKSANPHIEFTPGSLTFDSQTWADPQSIAFAVGEENQDASLTINHVIDGFGDTRDGDVTEGGTVTVSLIPSAAPEPEGKQAVQETLAGVAAAAVSNVTSNIGARFSAPSAPTGGVSVSLAGTPLSFGQAGSKYGGRGERASSASGFDAVGEESWQWRHQTMSTDALLRTSSFEIALGAAESDKGSLPGLASRITIWGQGDLQFFESGGGAKSGYDGDLAAGYLGADVAMEGGWLAGVAVSRIAAEADYTLGGGAGGGTLEAELTNVHPYIRAALNDRSEAWAILGVGAGELTDTAKGAAQTTGVESKSDMTMRMLSAGARHQLATDTGIDWAVLGDGSFASVETEDGTEAVDGITADVWRARLGVEASWTTVSASGSSFTSFLEVAGRQDGGDGATGLGLELSPGVSFSDPASGLSLEARGRALAVHSADNHREYGLSLTASVTPGADGRGLSLAIAPVWGTPEGALDEADRSLFFGDAGDRHPDDTLSLNSRIAWGFSAGHGVLVPFAALSLHDGYGHRLRVGSRYSLGSALDLELSGEGSGGSSGGSAHSVQVSGRLRF